MPTSPQSPPDSDAQDAFRADSLAIGMAVMLAITVIQRAVGFFRGVWFCRLMDDDVLGQWSMAQTFLVLITPVMLLGIPGCLPRFVEHFRRREQLGGFVRRIVQATLVCTAVCLGAMVASPSSFGWIIFANPGATSLVHGVVLAVTSTIVFNFFNDLNSSLRQVKVVSLMQFAQSLLLTVLGIVHLSRGGQLSGLLVCYSVATLLAIAPGAWSIRRGWRRLPPQQSRLDTGAMWRRLLPYAFALWMMNLVGNLFEMSDRYMILHFMPGGSEAGQSAVGQYHSARIFPTLLLSLGTMVSGVLMPYLTADWEAGNRDAVRARLKQVVLGLSALFTLGAAVVVWIAPWMFDNLLQGRYSDGLVLMPMAVVFCIWTAIVTVGQDYLWVAEKGRSVAIALAVGLVVNLILNVWLMPTHGLAGAVIATLVANAVVMVGVWYLMMHHGYRLDIADVMAGLMPAALLLGPHVAVCSVLAALVSTGQLTTISHQVAGWRWSTKLSPES
ncbi:MAG: oligosaccharide flippase family protein [Planctomycetota bacterium]